MKFANTTKEILAVCYVVVNLYVNLNISEYNQCKLCGDSNLKRYNIWIDQIKPGSKFNLDDEDECLQWVHSSNIRPLLFTQIMEKHKQWTDEDNEYWLQNIEVK